MVINARLTQEKHVWHTGILKCSPNDDLWIMECFIYLYSRWKWKLNILSECYKSTSRPCGLWAATKVTQKKRHPTCLSHCLCKGDLIWPTGNAECTNFILFACFELFKEEKIIFVKLKCLQLGLFDFISWLFFVIHWITLLITKKAMWFILSDISNLTQPR